MLPNQASRNFFKYRNSLTRSLTSSREKLVLLSEHQMKRYPIFLDKEIGIPDTYQNTIQDIGGDEDYDSSDEIVTYGIKQCLYILNSDGDVLTSSQRLSIQEEFDTKSTVKAKYSRTSTITFGHKNPQTANE